MGSAFNANYLYTLTVSIQALEHVTADNLHMTRQLCTEDIGPEMLTNPDFKFLILTPQLTAY